MKHLWISCCLILMSFSLAHCEASNQWRANWQSQANEVWLGLPFTLTLASVNGPNDHDLFIESHNNWKIETQKVQMVQGKTPTTVYRLNCIALKSGTLQLPLVELRSQQGVLEIPSVKLKVQSPEVHKESRLKIELSKNEIYEKEAFRIKAIWTTTMPLDAIKALKWVIPILEHPDLKVVEIHRVKPADESRSIGLPIGQRRIIGTWKTEFLEAKEANTLYFEILVQAQKAGEYEFNPSFLVCSVEKNLDKYKNKKWRGNRYPSYFNNNFFEGSQNSDDMKRTIVMSKANQLKVKALPPQARKSQAEVIVGKAKIKMSATPRKCQVGDPIHLEIKVTHDQPEVFHLPKLSSMEAFERNFRTPEDRSPAIYNDKKEKIYVQTLWPKRSDLSMIPPIVLNSFDPESGFYREISSNSIPIEVTGGESSVIDMAEFAGNLIIKSKVESDPEGIWNHVWDTKIQPEFKQGSPWLVRSLALVLVIIFIAAQFGPNVIHAFMKWRYDSFGQKAKRFLNDLYAWRNQTEQDLPLRSIVLKHLSEHLKQPKSRYDEEVLLEYLQKHHLDPGLYQQLVHWLNYQEQNYSPSKPKPDEGDIQNILLAIFRRRLV